MKKVKYINFMLQNSKRIGFLLLDNFSMIAFSNMLEVLRMANYVTQDNLYQWNVTGLDGHHSCASNGLQIQHTCVLPHLLNMDIVFICGGFQLYKNMTPYLKNFYIGLINKNCFRWFMYRCLCIGKSRSAKWLSC